MLGGQAADLVDAAQERGEIRRSVAFVLPPGVGSPLMTDYLAGDELLEILVRAERRLDGPREVFKVDPDRRQGAHVKHPGLRDPDDPESQPWLRCNKQDLVDLADSRYVKIAKRRTSVSGPGRKSTGFTLWEMHVTRQGFDHVDHLARVKARGRTESTGTLDWSADVLPVLIAACEASYDSTPELGATRSEIAMRLDAEPDEIDVARILFHLVEAGYLVDTAAHLRAMGEDGLPKAVRPTEKALQLAAGWPSGPADHIAAQLVAALDERIDRAEGEERSRLVRLRDGITGIGRDVLVAVLTDAAKRAGGEIV